MFRSEITRCYHDIAQIHPSIVFGSDLDSMAVNQPEDASTMAPGWVGRGYERGGLLLLAINPGGGGDAYVEPRADDVLLYRRLRAFRAARGDREVITAFEALNADWIALQRKHNVWLPMHAVLTALRLTVDDAAFLNIVPFRTRNDSMPRRTVVRAAWEHATRRQIELLAPARIVCLGYKAGDCLVSLGGHMMAAQVDRLKRSKGDRYLTPEAQALLRTLRLAAPVHSV